MNYELLIPPIIPYYLSGFRKDFYPQYFERYCQEARSELLTFAANPEANAAQLVRWMDTQVKGLLRSRKRLEQELFLMQYVVPAAIHLGCRPAAQALNQAWNKAHPELSFGIATYEEFYDSFNTAIMGFKVGGGN